MSGRDFIEVATSAGVPVILDPDSQDVHVYGFESLTYDDILAIASVIEKEKRIDPLSPKYCPKCDYDVHMCPGCGRSLRHGEYSCGEC